jgi:hypothetical protein
MDNTIEQVALPQEGQEQELEINLDMVDDAEALKAELAKKSDAIRQLTARAKAAEELVKKSRETSKTVETQAPVSTDYRDEVYDLRLDGYSREEAQFIMKNGGRKALEENNYVKVAIETLREQKKAEQAIPDIDSGKSDIERKYTPEQLEKMPMEELVKILPHA